MSFQTPRGRPEGKYEAYRTRPSERRRIPTRPTQDRKLSTNRTHDRGRDIDTRRGPPVKTYYDTRKTPGRSLANDTQFGGVGLGVVGDVTEEFGGSPIASYRGVEGAPTPFVTRGGGATSCPHCGTDTTPTNKVLVFGFNVSRASIVLSHFQKFGDIIKREDGPGNWTLLTYKSALHAEMALRENGTILDGDMMIGVQVPPTGLRGFGVGEREEGFTLQKQPEFGTDPTSSGLARLGEPKKRKRVPFSGSMWENIKDYIFHW